MLILVGFSVKYKILLISTFCNLRKLDEGNLEETTVMFRLVKNEYKNIQLICNLLKTCEFFLVFGFVLCETTRQKKALVVFLDNIKQSNLLVQTKNKGAKNNKKEKQIKG